MNFKQTLLKIFKKIKSFFKTIFKVLNRFRKMVFWVFKWLFKLSPKLKRKVFMASAVCFYDRVIGKKKKKKELGIKNKK